MFSTFLRSRRRLYIYIKHNLILNKKSQINFISQNHHNSSNLCLHRLIDCLTDHWILFKWQFLPILVALSLNFNFHLNVKFKAPKWSNKKKSFKGCVSVNKIVSWYDYLDIIGIIYDFPYVLGNKKKFLTHFKDYNQIQICFNNPFLFW